MALKTNVKIFRSRTEIKGGPGGPWPPQNISAVATVNLYSLLCQYFRITDRYSMLLCRVYLIQFLPVTSLGSSLGLFTS